MDRRIQLPEAVNNICSAARGSEKLLTIYKILFFIVCSTGFSYHAYQFIGLYLSYPTVIELKTVIPDTIVAPAITYCRVNRITRNKFCELFPNECVDITKKNETCKRLPDYCKKGIKVPSWNNNKLSSRLYINDLIDSGPEIIYFLYEPPWNISSDENVGPFYYAPWWSLNIFTCFTLHSRLNSSKETIEVELNLTKTKTDATARYFVSRMGFSVFNESEGFDSTALYNDSLGVAIAIHSPFTTALPQMKNLLKMDKKYEMEITIKEEHLLPAPFKTECINYTSLWEENNKSGPRSRSMCAEVCEARRDMACFGCIDIWNSFPHSEDKCVHDLFVDARNICNATIVEEYDSCISGCKRECLETTYTFSIAEKMIDPWDYRGYVPGLIEVDIFMDPIFVILKHRPQFQYIELFSNLGGYIGIWLGVSLFALTDIIRSTISILAPRLSNVRRKLKTAMEESSQSEATENSKLKREIVK